MSRIAVIGAAGYLGLRTVRRLIKDGHNVLAICRANGMLLLSGVDVEPCLPDQIHNRGKVDVVINLAYPTDGVSYERSMKIGEIGSLISGVAKDDAMVIHASTQAVFGYALERPIVLGDIPFHRDYEYVENKVRMEREIVRKFSQQKRVVVRLGNLWGPASPAWTVKLIERIRFGKPVSIEEIDGFSNVTDVDNVSDYFAYLVKNPPLASLTYHHLAEHSTVRWSFWLNRIADLFQTAPLSIADVPKFSTGLRDDLLGAVAVLRFKDMARELWHGRVTGSLFRSVLPHLPVGLRRRIARSGSDILLNELPEIVDDPAFLTLLACERQFTSVIDPNWRIPYSADVSWDRVARWMREVGYVD